MTMQPEYDVIVVGAGVIGLTTAYHLQKSSYKSLVLEQFSLFHSRGSSCGHTRLAKISHLQKYMSALMADALKTWKDLEKSSCSNLIIDSGHLAICHKSIAEKIDILKRGLVTINEEYELYYGGEIQQRFPGLQFDENFSALFESNGIVLLANKCLVALRDEVLKLGGMMHDEEKVLNVTSINSTLVRVETNKRTYTAKSVVLACGSWIKGMAGGLGITIPAQPVRVTMYYWKETKPGIYSVRNNFPPLVLHFKEYHLYSTPSFEYPGLTKICYHHRSPINPDFPNLVSDEDKILEKDRLETLKSMIRNHFPYMEENPVVEENCLQTVTPDLAPIVDRHPRHPNIIFGASFCGFGFGVAPEFGRILSELSTSLHLKTPYDRFTIASHSRNSKL